MNSNDIFESLKSQLEAIDAKLEKLDQRELEIEEEREALKAEKERVKVTFDMLAVIKGEHDEKLSKIKEAAGTLKVQTEGRQSATLGEVETFLDTISAVCPELDLKEPDQYDDLGAGESERVA